MFRSFLQFARRTFWHFDSAIKKILITVTSHRDSYLQDALSSLGPASSVVDLLMEPRAAVSPAIYFPPDVFTSAHSLPAVMYLVLHNG